MACVNEIVGLGCMSVFVIKMLTILGFVFYAGGPLDAVTLALYGDQNVAEPAVVCQNCESVAVIDLSQAISLVSLRSSVEGGFWDTASIEYNVGMAVDAVRADDTLSVARQGMK